MVLWSQKCRLTSVLSKCIRWEIYRLCSLVETSITLDLSSCNLYILHVLVHIIVSWGLISWISLPSPSAFSDLVDLIKDPLACVLQWFYDLKNDALCLCYSLMICFYLKQNVHTHTHTYNTHTETHTQRHVCVWVYIHVSDINAFMYTLNVCVEGYCYEKTML